MAKKNDRVEDAANEPERITVDGQSVTNRSIQELIDAAKHKAATSINPFDVLTKNSKKGIR